MRRGPRAGRHAGAALGVPRRVPVRVHALVARRLLPRRVWVAGGGGGADPRRAQRGLEIVRGQCVAGLCVCARACVLACGAVRWGCARACVYRSAGPSVTMLGVLRPKGCPARPTAHLGTRVILHSWAKEQLPAASRSRSRVWFFPTPSGGRSNRGCSGS